MRFLDLVSGKRIVGGRSTSWVRIVQRFRSYAVLSVQGELEKEFGGA